VKIFCFEPQEDIQITVGAETLKEARQKLLDRFCRDSYKRPVPTGRVRAYWDEDISVSVDLDANLIKDMLPSVVIPDTYTHEFNVHLCAFAEKVEKIEDTVKQFKKVKELRSESQTTTTPELVSTPTEKAPVRRRTNRNQGAKRSGEK
jgi:hypothetical protein